MEERLNTLITLFKEANQEFLDQNKSIILTDTNERTLCGSLAQHLRSKISHSKYCNYYVDVEYNRNNRKVKTIINDKLKIDKINCDIIIHSRGEIIKKDNLIAVEMKKSNRSASKKQEDKMRLIALTKESFDGIWFNDGKTFPKHVCGYDLGVYYEVNRRTKRVLLEYYIKGEFSKREFIEFN